MAAPLVVHSLTRGHRGHIRRPKANPVVIASAHEKLLPGTANAGCRPWALVRRPLLLRSLQLEVHEVAAELEDVGVVEERALALGEVAEREIGDAGLHRSLRLAVAHPAAVGGEHPVTGELALRV